ncbi:MAG TPA: FecR domain-containing protein, partial [Syntrophorhabdaceae bacterium]|nr:FecR domain-containing protein [Syntrophorhabdaceae bacterium]
NRIKDPNIIYPDQRLIIPVRLLRGSPMDGTVTFVKGDAMLQRNNSQEWIKLKQGDLIKQGDSLKTGDKSTLEITFEDKSILFMRPNTLLTVNTLEKKGVFAIVNNINLKSGKAISNIKKITGTEPRYEVTTPSAIASVRGTDFRISVDEKWATRAEVLDGHIMVKATGKSVEVNAGEGTVVEKDATPLSPVRLIEPPNLIDIRPIYKDIPLIFKFTYSEGTKSIRASLTRDEDGKDIVHEAIIKPDEPFSITSLEDGSYYLSSYAIDGLGLEGNKSKPVPIKFRANPLPPFIQIEGEDVEAVGKSFDFKWLSVKDAVKYHIQIAKDREFNNIVEEVNDHNGTTYKTGVLDYGIYYLRVCSVASDGYEGGWSVVIRFHLIPPPPSPSMEKPSIDKDAISLRWKHLGEGITYHFQMAKDEAFKEIMLDTKLEKSEITIKKPEEPGIYYVRTSSIDKKGREGNFSPPQSFEIEKGFPFEILTIIMGLGLINLLAF